MRTINTRAGLVYIPEINDLVGKIFTSVVSTDDTLTFENNSEKFVFYHRQDCCEGVYIESIVGDLDSLVNEPILLAEEVVSPDTNPDGVEPPEYQDSFTWTFYKFATLRGYVDVRWYGESNGYYSENVDLQYTNKLN